MVSVQDKLSYRVHNLCILPRQQKGTENLLRLLALICNAVDKFVHKLNNHSKFDGLQSLFVSYNAFYVIHHVSPYSCCMS